MSTARDGGFADAARTCCNCAVPWCVSCNKFLTPPTVRADGTCPRCGGEVERGLIPGMTRPSKKDGPPGVPWHLKLLGLALTIYLSFRAFQIVDWILHH